MNLEIITAALQALTLYILHRIDARLDSHSERIRIIEIRCAKKHPEENKP